MAKKNHFDYFDAFMRQADFATQEAHKLKEYLLDYDPSRIGEVSVDMHSIEHNADNVNHEIFAAVATEFITPIEREDIIKLAQLLDEVVDCLEDVIQRFYMYNVQEVHPRAQECAILVAKIVEATKEAVSEFRNFKKSDSLRAKLIAISDLEEEGDRLQMDSTRELYQNHEAHPVQILVWNNIFNRMEHCCDACDHVAAAMETIVMKND